MKARSVSVCLTALCLCGPASAQEAPADPLVNLMHQAKLLDTSGDYVEAAAVYREAVRIADATHDARLPIALNALANVDDSLGRYSEAEPLFRRALDITTANGANEAIHALTLSNLGVHYLEMGQHSKAQKMLLEAAVALAMVLPADSLQLALTRNAMANLALGDGQFDQAEKLIEASLATFRKNPRTAAEQLAVGVNNLGVVRRQQGRSAEALQLFEESIHIVETEISTEHPILLRSLANAAIIYAELGRNAEAEAAFQRSLAITEKRLGISHPSYAAVLLKYAGFLRLSGKKPQAKKLEARANSLLHDHSIANGRGLTVDVSAFRH